MFNKKKKEAAQANSRVENLESENERLRGVVDRVRFIVQTNRNRLDAGNQEAEGLPGKVAEDLVQLADKRRSIGSLDTDRNLQSDVINSADHLNKIRDRLKENQARMYANMVEYLEDVLENQESEITEQGHA